MQNDIRHNGYELEDEGRVIARNNLFTMGGSYATIQPRQNTERPTTTACKVNQYRLLQWRYRNGAAAYFTTAHLEPRAVGQAECGFQYPATPGGMDGLFAYFQTFRAARLEKAIKFRKEQMARWNFKREQKAKAANA